MSSQVLPIVSWYRSSWVQTQLMETVRGRYIATYKTGRALESLGSIKFTHEEESEGAIPFLHTIIDRKLDRSVKLLVSVRKPTS